MHYKGKDFDLFYDYLSEILFSCITKFYENNIIKHIINCNYFYFTEIEQRKIFETAINYINTNELEECCFRKNTIESSCIEYFANHRSVILDGFINFRINDYIKILDCIVDLAVNKFVIDREYLEFIDLLKFYINSKPYGPNSVHLVYNLQESILLDEFKKTINIDDTPLNNKYVSDISFSSNDYTLNALLTLLPKKIFIHIIDGVEDDFINTLKLIFDNRIYICNDCNICKTYKLIKMQK